MSQRTRALIIKDVKVQILECKSILFIIIMSRVYGEIIQKKKLLKYLEVLLCQLQIYLIIIEMTKYLSFTYCFYLILFIFPHGQSYVKIMPLNIIRLLL